MLQYIKFHHNIVKVAIEECMSGRRDEYVSIDLENDCKSIAIIKSEYISSSSEYCIDACI